MKRKISNVSILILYSKRVPCYISVKGKRSRLYIIIEDLTQVVILNEVD